MESIKQKRADCWENCLTDEQQRELYRWSITPVEDDEGKPRRPSFDECMAHLREVLCGRVETRPAEGEAGEDGRARLRATVSMPSRQGWFRFKARMEKDRRLEMLFSIQGSGESAKDMTAMSPADYATAADAFTNLAVDAAMKGCDKAVAIYSGAARHYREMMQAEKIIDLKSRAQATKEDQLRLAREKFEAAERRLQAVQDAVDKAKGGKLDPAKVADEIDKILGRKK